MSYTARQKERRPSGPCPLILKIRLRWLFLGLAALSCACNSHDADRLARVSHKAAAKIQDLAGPANHKLITGWDAMRADLDEMALDARVSARLRWDKGLANTHILVQAQGGRVVLTGTVADRSQRNRAEDLAQSTRGAEEVVDQLEVQGFNSGQ